MQGSVFEAENTTGTVDKGISIGNKMLKDVPAGTGLLHWTDILYWIPVFITI